MSKARPIHWNLLTDDVLKELGKKDSLQAASTAISEEMRAWGLSTSDGLVICHDSVIHAEGEDGVVWVEKQTARHERIAFGQEAAASNADMLSAALALLTTAFAKPETVDAEVRRRAQGVVDDILLEHPVLLHPRLVVPVYLPGHNAISKMPVLSALVASKGGTLPSSQNGVDDARLRTFANSKLVTAPFVRNTTRRAWAASAEVGRKKYEVDGGKALAGSLSMFGAAKPAMVASILELSRLRGYDKAIVTPKGEGQPEIHIMLRAAFPISLGMHAHLAPSSIIRPERCSAFVAEIVAGGYLRSLAVQVGLAEDLLKHLMMKVWGLAQHRTPAPPEMIAQNCELVLSGLAECGVAQGRAAAARWLVHHSIRDGRTGLSLPTTEVQNAIAFFETVTAAGLPIADAQPLDLNGRTPEFQVWNSAFEIFSRQHAMESVLAASDVTSSNDPASAAQPPRRRLRAL